MRNWTKAQSDAINIRGGAVAVSASAGSGKTAALVQRVISKITDPSSPVALENILVMTFSEAAANEMKCRIREELLSLLEKDPQNQLLSKSLLAIDNAKISTVHAFCLDLIRSHFEKLGLPADFRTADENELYLLMEETCAEVLELYYQRSAPAFFELVELLSKYRDDSAIVSVVFKLYQFVRAHPFYDIWLHDCIEYYNPDIPLAESVWGSSLLSFIDSAIDNVNYKLQAAFDILESCDENLAKSFTPIFLSIKESFEKYSSLVAEKNWDSLYNELKTFSLPRLIPVKADTDTLAKNTLVYFRDSIKDSVAEIQKRVACTTAEYIDDTVALRPLIEDLFSLLLDFDSMLAAKKRERGIIDFSDMEHFALSLLFDSSVPYPFPKSTVAEELSAHYDELLIDEYQDTNAAQDLIFSAISKDNSNLFVVGDVKQSIYRFRQAMPEIFLKKINSAHPIDEGAFPAKIIFGENFRSRPEILDGVNYIFSQIMSTVIGEIDYNSEHSLICGGSFAEQDSSGVFLKLIDYDSDNELSSAETEADFVACMIKEMLDNRETISDGQSVRPITPSDIAILMRSPADRFDIYAAALNSKGIGAAGSGAGNFLSSPEISAVISLLKVILNPTSDIDLSAALLSEFFAFTPDHLARMRLENRSVPLFSCLKSLAEKGESPFACAYRDISFFRSLYSTLPCGAFIRKIYDYTAYFAAVSGQEGAEAKTANLNLLVQYAENYDSHGIHGLSGFIRYVSRIQEQNRDFTPAFSSNNGNCVKIMSIHASKGLEFPVTFICDCAKRFNKTDLRSNCLLHPKLGFACVRKNGSVTFPTLQREAVSLELESALLSEELRTLYVAMTRAKSKLYITACTKNIQNKINDISYEISNSEKVPSYVIRNQNSFFEWIVSALLKHPDADILRNLSDRGNKIGIADAVNSKWNIEIIKHSPLLNETESVSEAAALPNSALVEQLSSLASFEYRFAESLRIPSKMSVSELSSSSHRSEDFLFAAVPSFTMKNEFSPAQVGSINHLFLQMMDINNAASGLTGELERLKKLRFFSDKEAETVDIEAVRIFLKSDLFKRMQNAEKLYREYKFIYNAPSEYLGYPCGESISLQGIADCVFIENDTLVIADYKTDKVSSEEELVKRYSTQLRIYSDILAKIFELPVAETIIYSLHLHKEISLRNYPELL